MSTCEFESIEQLPPRVASKPKRFDLPKMRISKIFAIAIIAFALIAGACGSQDEAEAETGIEVIQKLAQAMREDDMTLLEESFAGNDSWFIEWQTALKAEPEFVSCTESLNTVKCDVVYGDDFFYTQVLNEQVNSTIGGRVSDGKFRGTTWPPWKGLTTVEDELRTWVKENRPELETELYGTPSYSGLIKMTRESGELRMELLDDFLSSR